MTNDLNEHYEDKDLISFDDFARAWIDDKCVYDPNSDEELELLKDLEGY